MTDPKELRMTTRDGVELAGDLYLTGDVRDALPTILVRTPYDKSGPSERERGSFWVDNGYACFIQDCRGRYRSEGGFYKYLNEAEK